uniref:Large ribosomal subunit protein bL19c n=1 Tax=Vertebrata isogona TaxID=2006944 RepID=A0A1Z1MET9_9FLOR|nr:ribosomal protein L19 [Vertebrata isogona]ARW64597.1 ribosomal protein L19 [Vertebrata isogona]
MLKHKKNLSPLINLIEANYTKKNLPLIEIGDSIKIKKVIQEGNKERIQMSEGVVIGQNNSSINKTITIRKTIQNIGVERIYLIHSPQIINIEIIKKAKVRKSKLYYLRKRSGKSTRLKQRTNA